MPENNNNGEIELLKNHIATLKGYIQTNANNHGELFEVVEDMQVQTEEFKRAIENLSAGIAGIAIQGGGGASSGAIASVTFDRDNEALVITDGTGNDTVLDLSYFDDNCFDTLETAMLPLTPTYVTTTGAWLPGGTVDLAARALVVAEGRAIEKGVVELPGHGLIVGMEYVSDPNNIGQAIPRTLLAAGEPYQKLFTVVNPDEITVDVEPYIDSTVTPDLVCVETFNGFAGGETTVTVSETIPDNVKVFVVRNGDYKTEGLLNDYLQAGQDFTFTQPLAVGEVVTVYWIKSVNSIISEDFVGTAGQTQLTFTLDTLPTDTNNIIVHNNGDYLTHLVDYTIVGQDIVPTATIAAGDLFTVTILK